MNRLIPVSKVEDIFPTYQHTPIGRLLQYHNLAAPFESYLKVELLIGM
jgi:carbonic anhydrase